MKKYLLVALLVAFSICAQAQELKRGGYPLEEVTFQYTEQGYEMYEDYDEDSKRKCYVISTDHADMFYYMDEDNELVTSSYVWPNGGEALRAFIGLYNEHYEILNESQWRIDVDGGAVYIALREDEGEYFFEFIYTID